MAESEEKTPLNQKEHQLVSEAADQLVDFACTLSAQYIRDGRLRLEFNDEVACLAGELVESFQREVKDVVGAIDALYEEYRTAIEQASDYLTLVVGLIAGVYQIVGGVVMIRGGGPFVKLAGAFSVLHGVNNVYENGRNLLTGRLDTEGPVRKIYQMAAKDDARGNIAYGSVDLALSGFGLLRGVPSVDARKLWRYIDSDMVHAYQETKWFPLGADIFSSSITADGVFDTLDKSMERER